MQGTRVCELGVSRGSQLSAGPCELQKREETQGTSPSTPRTITTEPGSPERNGMAVAAPSLVVSLPSPGVSHHWSVPGSSQALRPEASTIRGQREVFFFFFKKKIKTFNE